MPIIQPISDHRLAVENLPAPEVISMLSVNSIYMLARTVSNTTYTCYIKILNKIPVIAPEESEPYDCDITGPAVYIEDDGNKITAGEIGIRTMKMILSNGTHTSSDNWIIYTSSSSEYNTAVDLVMDAIL